MTIGRKTNGRMDKLLTVTNCRMNFSSPTFGRNVYCHFDKMSHEKRYYPQLSTKLAQLYEYHSH